MASLFLSLKRVPVAALPKISRVLRSFGPTRRAILNFERVPPFLSVVFSSDGLGSRKGRTLILGKARRLALSAVPGVANRLQKHYGLVGGCVSCGTSCNLLMRCPHWDSGTRLCTVYEDRPSICRTFPITPADIRDRNLMNESAQCGFTIQKTVEEVR